MKRIFISSLSFILSCSILTPRESDFVQCNTYTFSAQSFEIDSETPTSKVQLHFDHQGESYYYNSEQDGTIQFQLPFRPFLYDISSLDTLIIGDTVVSKYLPYRSTFPTNECSTFSKIQLSSLGFYVIAIDSSYLKENLSHVQIYCDPLTSAPSRHSIINPIFNIVDTVVFGVAPHESYKISIYIYGQSSQIIGIHSDTAKITRFGKTFYRAIRK
jgi:hypothetical protein